MSQLTPQAEAEKRLIEAAMAVRAMSHDLYTELCAALFFYKEHRRDLAINAATELQIGAARGATDIHRLIANASTLLAETTRR